MTDAQTAAIQKHGRDLLAIFPNATEQDPINLCKRLRRIETKAHALMEARCNGTTGETEDMEEKADSALLKRVGKVLGDTGSVPVFLNGDPRGYALKIDQEYVSAENIDIHRDMGGYGILAPAIGRDGR